MARRLKYPRWSVLPLPELEPLGADDEWLEKWAPMCPDGNRQRVCEIAGFRLKGADYLQLRVILRPRDSGVCQCIVEEHDDSIYVRALACREPEQRRRKFETDEVDCPCNWWLDAPLGERIVVDVDTDRELPLFIPRWGTDAPSEYVPRPPGLLWHPDEGRVDREGSAGESPPAGNNGSNG